MKSKTKTKKSQCNVKLADMRPKKDPKAGTPPDPCGPRSAHVRSTLPCVR